MTDEQYDQILIMIRDSVKAVETDVKGLKKDVVPMSASLAVLKDFKNRAEKMFWLLFTALLGMLAKMFHG